MCVPSGNLFNIEKIVCRSQVGLMFYIYNIYIYICKHAGMINIIYKSSRKVKNLMITWNIGKKMYRMAT